jgi:hypothetical protein
MAFDFRKHRLATFGHGDVTSAQRLDDKFSPFEAAAFLGIGPDRGPTALLKAARG